jgi:hypothetical protein
LNSKFNTYPPSIGRKHSYIRTKENEAGQTHAFLVIDGRVTTDCAVWYVGSFTTEYELDDDGTGLAASPTDALHEVLVKAFMVA